MSESTNSTAVWQLVIAFTLQTTLYSTI